ncbi:SIMPL domain-containing protein [Roseomonas sp. SXEYE001]|nr:SIMPL domain-containing protein [Roseomonas sp. SXEYE001]MCV4208340.1 SIMPL domain-containing protein [Roseomonas sp. SXEYE001]
MLALCLLAPWALPEAATAQSMTQVYPGPGTVLRLSETADVTRAPDEIQATLQFEAREATATGAQSSVNRAMTAALEAARGVPGVTVSTGGYRTYRQEDPVRWVASQSLSLRSGDPAKLLELVWTLQGRGLAVNGINYALTREATRAARQEAASLALDALRRRAEGVAEQLGMKVERIAEVQLETSEVGVPRPMMMQAASARAAAPPVAQAEDVVVPAMVQAVVVLAPR